MHNRVLFFFFFSSFSSFGVFVVGVVRIAFDNGDNINRNVVHILPFHCPKLPIAFKCNPFTTNSPIRVRTLTNNEFEFQIRVTKCVERVFVCDVRCACAYERIHSLDRVHTNTCST